MIRRALVSPKDKAPLENKSGVVYYIKCKTCGVDYVGETVRSFKQRKAEHARPSNISSPIQQHIQETGHTIDWSEAQILDQDNDWHGRGVRESINIFKIGPVLNRDKGRYKLPKIYHRLLHDGGGGAESDSSSDQE